MNGSDGDRSSATESAEETELVYHSDGQIELRSQDRTGRWIRTDSPVEIRR
ncbi:hypothetical protein SAMN06269185_3193 [Natronoarchaeum philippinense]|uniref:YD repeat-containing protein n=1 Tax=Natronoarchaeum philippinense TaxID=558529 RepID=A0A285P9S6_NATPI|nr:hypothetical protein [Natronoarchaeum philippinense]SNZ17997.1 hypothetical protein SAMN06269185_3193 [Natronoarchaeum philippinense]